MSDRSTQSLINPIFITTRLAGHLYEATWNSEYLAAATAAAEFIEAHMIRDDGIVMDTFNVSGCNEVAIRGPLSYTTGFTLWGTSILATHNESWTSL